MRRTSARLADGREIVYFDADDFRPDRRVHDPRDLGPVSTASEIRYDPVLDEWVAMASHRQSRTHLPPTDECPLCPSRPGRQTEVPAADYDVAVFENRFPSFATRLDQPVDGHPVSVADEIFARGPGLGRCEVVCYTSDHDAAFSQLSPEHVGLVVEAWADRTRELSAVPHVEQVFCFENRGEEIGVTLVHPHGQIYAYPFVTPRTRRMLDSARRHRERTWRNLFADVLAAELADGSRVVTASEHWVAFVPSAARWPVEVHLYPRRQVPDLPGLTDDERKDFARTYLHVLRAMDGLYGLPLPYISAWHQAPVRIDRDLAYLHLQLFSVKRAANKLKYLAGSESGMGVFINDVTPEQAASACVRQLPMRGPAMTVAEAFRMTYDVRPSGVWSAPGRVNLIGEHTDYNDGFVLPFAIAARTSVAAAPGRDGLLRMRSLQQPSGDASVTLDALEPGRPGGWASYVAGVVWAALEQGHDVGGADLLVDGRVPLGGGLSSSHALEVAVAIAVNDLFELDLDTDALADLTQLAENEFVGAPTGLMDQLALLRGQAGNALFLDTRSLHSEQVPLDPGADGYALIVIDTKVHHSLGDGAYADRRSACERAAAELGVGSLRDLPLDGLDQRLAHLDDELCRRARHVVTENARVPAAVDALRSHEWTGLGVLMDASHTSLRDDYEVSCDELDVTVEAARRAGALGARMTGGGFGGSAIAIVPYGRTSAVRREVATAFAAQDWPTPEVFEVAPSDGARRDH